MKFKVLSCLLASSVMFSAQSFTVTNETSKNIVLEGFGWHNATNNLNVIDNKPPITIPPTHTVSFLPKYTKVLFLIDKKSKPMNGLSEKAVVTFIEIDGNVRYDVSKDGPFKNTEK